LVALLLLDVPKMENINIVDGSVDVTVDAKRLFWGNTYGLVLHNPVVASVRKKQPNLIVPRQSI